MISLVVCWEKFGLRVIGLPMACGWCMRRRMSTPQDPARRRREKRRRYKKEQERLLRKAEREAGCVSQPEAAVVDRAV